VRFKTWLRADEQVELIGSEGWYWRSGHFSRREEIARAWGSFWEGSSPEHVERERSIMRELLTPEEVRHLEVAEGRWHLPGPPP